MKEGIGLANYRGHDGRTLCVEWSAILEENSPSGLIYSGGDDYSVHVWKMEKQENKLPPKGKIDARVFVKLDAEFSQ